MTVAPALKSHIAVYAYQSHIQVTSTSAQMYKNAHF